MENESPVTQEILLQLDAVKAQLGPKNDAISTPMTVIRVHQPSTVDSEVAVSPLPKDYVSIPLLILQDTQLAFPLLPSVRITKCQDPSAEMFELAFTDGDPITLTFSGPQDAQKFQEMLAHYLDYAIPDLYRNELVLVDQQSGEVVGRLEQLSQDQQEDILLETEHGQVALVEYDPNAKQGFRFTLRSAGDVLVSGSEWVSQAMVSGAQMLGGVIQSNAQKWKTQMSPTEKPVLINASLKNNIKGLRGYTHRATVVSGSMKRMVKSAASRVGSSFANFLAPPPTDTANPEKKESDFKYLIRQGLIAADKIFDGFGQSFQILATEGGQATVQLVQHKYGEEAGKVAEDAAYAVGNLGVVYFDARGMSHKAIIKVMGKTAAKQTVKNVVHLTKENTNSANKATTQ